MYLKAVISILLLSCILTGEVGAKRGGGHGGWGYGGSIGPEHWDDMFPTCGGDKQSPIDIVTEDAEADDKLKMINFLGYENQIKNARVTNNGHTVMLDDEDTEASISGGGLPSTYKFKQLHFHWGGGNDRGSEHTINGHKYPLEMHLVHMNKKYKTVEDAVKKNDGLAVLGILFEITEEDNKELEPLIEALDEVISEGSSTHLEDDFDLDQLIPDDTLPYYRYEGSLTTPLCNEAVIWTVFKHTQHISKKQLEQFRRLEEQHDGDKDSQMEDNFRPPQPLNGRTVKVSVDTGDKDDPDEDDKNGKDDGAGQLVPSLLTLTALLAGAIRRIF